MVKNKKKINTHWSNDYVYSSDEKGFFVQTNLGVAEIPVFRAESAYGFYEDKEFKVKLFKEHNENTFVDLMLSERPDVVLFHSVTDEGVFASVLFDV